MKSIKPKTIKFDTLYHIGTLKKENKGSLNFEGNGLSVSVNPIEWLSIARGKLNGGYYLLENKDCKLADFFDFDFDVIKRFGLEHNLVNEVEVYSEVYHDDDLDQTLENIYETLEHAKENNVNLENLDLKKVIIPTQLFKDKLFPVVPCQYDEYQHLFTLYVQMYHPKIDGVWYNYKLDELAYSAPAGTIFNHKINKLNIKQIKYDDLPEREE